MRMFKLQQDPPKTFCGYWMEEPFYIPEDSFNAQYRPREEEPYQRYFYYSKIGQQSCDGGYYRILEIK